MLIFAMKPDHDGGVAVVDTATRELVLAYEAEKDSFPRYSPFNPINMLEAASKLGQIPDVFAISGWAKASPTPNNQIGAGYGGLDRQVFPASVFGKSVQFFSSSHALSHIWSAYGLSPFPQGQPCYVLIWEGALGDFYEIDSELNVHHLGQVMKAPGNKYGFLYSLGDPTFDLPRGRMRFGDPGKLMALCAYGEAGGPNDEEQVLIAQILDHQTILNASKDDFRTSPFYSLGLLAPAFTRLARRFSDELFRRFEAFARDNLTKGHPLLIAGGCGLNCDWNSAWKDSGLFEDVFIPPCPNDSGSAIGTAVDAMRELTGQAKLLWTPYNGQPFHDDAPEMPDVITEDLDIDKVANALADGWVVAWAQGRCEIGPRALGNRSLLASPFSPAMSERLNRIKQRENFRPIAPVCLEEDVHMHFAWKGPSPYMLYFQEVLDHRLKAITHVDGSARVQTVRTDQNPLLHELLVRFRLRTGVGVLCNTSLNFNGCGFINRTSDLYSFCRLHGVDAFAYGERLCRFQKGSF